MKAAVMELVIGWRFLVCGRSDEDWHHGKMAACGRVGDDRWGDWRFHDPSRARQSTDWVEGGTLSLTPTRGPPLEVSPDPAHPRPRSGTCLHLLESSEAVLVIAVALAPRPARAWGSAVHPAPYPTPNGRLPAGTPSARPGATAGRSRTSFHRPITVI